VHDTKILNHFTLNLDDYVDVVIVVAVFRDDEFILTVCVVLCFFNFADNQISSNICSHAHFGENVDEDVLIEEGVLIEMPLHASRCWSCILPMCDDLRL